jgi:Uncharacterized alpha/beta hydrolase domain (DUF2235)
MSNFNAGWYSVKKYANGNRFCLYFRNAEFYTAKCTVDSNGRQFLVWQDPGGPTGPGQPGRWLPSYEYLPNAPADDWWDNPRTSAKYEPKNPGDFSRSARISTAKELSQRAGATNAADASGLCCTKEIHVGVFFDGTNNNMDRDRPDKGHSNVVTLYDAHKDDKKEFFRYYIPGVGTRFAAIGEEAESNHDGNTFAAGGEARIHFGMLQVFNAVCRAATASDLLTPAEMKSLVTSTFGGLGTLWRWGDDKMVSVFRGLDARLLKAVEGKRPKVTKVNVSVIGFSRGAAQARSFAQWIQQATGGSVGGAAFSLRFLGIFDTVASVALADSSPVGGSGFMDWANGTMGIAGVERTAHFVAAHEIRRSFPLSTARAGGVWPSGVKEYVYPGAHSDVGGGYSPGDQGKATSGRSALLAQIPLNDMYHEALNAAVKVRTKPELPAVVQADFAIDPSLDKAFSDYAAWTTLYNEKQNVAESGGAPENRMHYHTQLYWRWRAHVSPDGTFKALSSYTNAGGQDKTDLWEAELDWRRDVATAQAAEQPNYDYVPTLAGPIRSADKRSHANALQHDILNQVGKAADVPAPVSDFFDRHVHDSHAGFWMLGPRTKLEKKQLITEIKDKQAEHERLLKLAAEQGNPGRARNFRNQASYYELNQFEQRVVAADAASPGSMPVFTDADAAELRGRAGVMTSATLALMGTATRREAAGHGRYRRIFDQS